MLNMRNVQETKYKIIYEVNFSKEILYVIRDEISEASGICVGSPRPCGLPRILNSN